MRLRASIPLLLIYLVLSSALSLAQIRRADPSAVRARASAGEHPMAASPSLNLCVEGSSLYPCPADIRSDNNYIPAITYTYGQVLDGAAAFPYTPSDGYATITSNGATICTLYADMPQLACPPDSTNFSPGTYTLVLLYTNPDAGTTVAAAPVVVTVNQDTSSIALQSSQNPAPLGVLVSFTATVTGSYGEPAAGQAVFTVDGVAAATATLDGNGAAAFTTSTLPIGVHRVEASYAGFTGFLAASADAELAETILPPGTATSIASSVNPSALGQNVTFTASVAAITTALHPSGAVSFNDGTKTFATVLVLPQGVALTNISTLASGTHSITASYSGDAATGPSVSPILTQQVDYPLTQATPGFTVTVTPSPVVLGVGLTANLTVVVSPKSGFSGPVTLTCGDLPRESTCIFGETVIPAGGGTTTLDLHVTSPHDCGSTIPYFYGANRPGPGGLIHRGVRYGVPTLAGVLLLLVPGRRRRGKGLLIALAVIGLAGLGGCNSTCTDFGTYPGSYTFHVTGTAPAGTGATSTGSGATLTAQASVGLTVKI